MHEPVTGTDFDNLIKYINRYEGYFTSQHARLSGYSVQSQFYHVKQGHWEKHGRGIFRYKYFPCLPYQRPDAIVAYLWTCARTGAPQGVISHDTALSVHKLSTWYGSGIHITVPKGFRKRSQCIYRTRLHYNELDESDIEDLGCFRLTKPLRTIIDLLLSTHIERIHIIDAMNDALRQGVITCRRMKEAKLNPQERELLIGLLRSINYARVDEI